MALKRPAEWATGLIALVGALVTWGVLDEAQAAWIIGIIGAVPGAVSWAVDKWRSRPDF